MKSLGMRILFLIGLALLTTSQAPAQSLWNHRVPYYSNLFSDTQVRGLGDLVTVIIRENTDVDNRDQRQMDRDAETRGGLNFTYGLGGKLGNESGSAAMDFSSTGEGKFDGKSQYTVEREFTDRITCSVVNLLPNGNLVIYGKLDRVVTGERRALVVSGIIRPFDVLPDNSIESKYVANFHVCYNGDGIDSRFIKQGWLTKAWNKYRPY